MSGDSGDESMEGSPGDGEEGSEVKSSGEDEESSEESGEEDDDAEESDEDEPGSSEEDMESESDHEENDADDDGWESETEEGSDSDEQDMNGTAAGTSSQDLASGEASASEEDAEHCPICLDCIQDQDVGTPESCDHSFCLQCIVEWSKMVNTCPKDRQVFNIIFARHSLEGTVYKKIPVADHQLQLEEEVIEDTTACEVCGQGDREDQLLLCDACDLGYHMDCLDRPLRQVPVGEWFCPVCAPTAPVAAGDSDDDDEMVIRPRRRQIARTIVFERVRANLAQRRIISDDESECEAMEMATSSNRRPRAGSSSRGSRPAARRRVSRRRKTSRRRVTRKGRKITKRKARNTTKTREPSSGTTRRRKTKGRRKKRKGKKKTARTKKSSTPATIKGRLAGRLRLRAPPVGRTIPLVRGQSTRGLDAQRADIGVTELSIMGDRDALDHFVSDDEGAVLAQGGVAVVPPAALRVGRQYSKASLKSHLPLRLGAAQRRATMKVGQPPCPGAGMFDLLGNILQEQRTLHLDAQNFKIHRDGSLEVQMQQPSINRDTNHNHKGSGDTGPAPDDSDESGEDSPTDGNPSNESNSNNAVEHSADNTAGGQSESQNLELSNSNDNTGACASYGDAPIDGASFAMETGCHNDATNEDPEQTDEAAASKEQKDTHSADSSRNAAQADSDKLAALASKSNCSSPASDCAGNSPKGSDVNTSENSLQSARQVALLDSGRLYSDEEWEDAPPTNVDGTQQSADDVDLGNASRTPEAESASCKRTFSQDFDSTPPRLKARRKSPKIPTRSLKRGKSEDAKSPVGFSHTEAEGWDDNTELVQLSTHDSGESSLAVEDGVTQPEVEEEEEDALSDNRVPISELPRIPKKKRPKLEEVVQEDLEDDATKDYPPFTVCSVLQRLGPEPTEQDSYHVYEKRDRKDRDRKDRSRERRDDEDWERRSSRHKHWRENKEENEEGERGEGRSRHRRRRHSRSKSKERSRERDRRSRDREERSRDRRSRRSRSWSNERSERSWRKSRDRSRSREKSRDRSRDRSSRSHKKKKSRDQSRERRRRSRSRSRHRDRERDRESRREPRGRSGDRGRSREEHYTSEGGADYKGTLKMFSQSLKEAAENEAAQHGRRFKLKRDFHQRSQASGELDIEFIDLTKPTKSGSDDEAERTEENESMDARTLDSDNHTPEQKAEAHAEEQDSWENAQDAGNTGATSDGTPTREEEPDSAPAPPSVLKDVYDPADPTEERDSIGDSEEENSHLFAADVGPVELPRMPHPGPGLLQHPPPRLEFIREPVPFIEHGSLPIVRVGLRVGVPPPQASIMAGPPPFPARGFPRFPPRLGWQQVRPTPNIIMPNRVAVRVNQNGIPVHGELPERFPPEPHPLIPIQPPDLRLRPPFAGIEINAPPLALPAKALEEMQQISQLLNAQSVLSETNQESNNQEKRRADDDLFLTPLPPPPKSAVGAGEVRVRSAISSGSSEDVNTAEVTEVVDMDVASPLSDDELLMSFTPPPLKVDEEEGKTEKENQEKSAKMLRFKDNVKMSADTAPASSSGRKEEKRLKKLNRQERVIEEVKLAIKPFYSKGRIDKDEYKEIMRKAVPKICKSGDINPVKIQAYIEAYVEKYRKARKRSDKTMASASNGLKKHRSRKKR